jgi:hypothetical protein
MNGVRCVMHNGCRTLRRSLRGVNTEPFPLGKLNETEREELGRIHTRRGLRERLEFLRARIRCDGQLTETGAGRCVRPHRHQDLLQRLLLDLLFAGW